MVAESLRFQSAAVFVLISLNQFLFDNQTLLGIQTMYISKLNNNELGQNIFVNSRILDESKSKTRTICEQFSNTLCLRAISMDCFRAELPSKLLFIRFFFSIFNVNGFQVRCHTHCGAAVELKEQEMEWTERNSLTAKIERTKAQNEYNY